MSVQIPSKLVVPALWEEPWSEAIENATPGTDRQIVFTQSSGAHLLRLIEERTFSFERLAWLTLWNKSYWILDSARSAFRTSAEYALDVLARVSFELWLHVKTIAEQDGDERLRAYTAWCIASDVNYQQQLVRPDTLDAIWDSRPAQNILSDQARLEEWEKMFGPLKIDVDQKNLRAGRFRQQNQERHRLHRLKSWLAHKDLLPWKRKLDLLTRNQFQVSFFALVDPSVSSVRKQLRSLETEPHLMYLPYVQGSLWIHGSTLEQIMDFASDRSIGPRPPRNAESCQSMADFIQSECMNVFISLNQLRGVFLRQEPNPQNAKL